MGREGVLVAIVTLASSKSCVEFRVLSWPGSELQRYLPGFPDGGVPADPLYTEAEN